MMMSASLRKLFFAFAVAIFLFGRPLSSFAGYRDDHFIAWISLGKGVDDQEITKKISDFANGDRIDSACKINWSNNDSILYVETRPLGVTDELIRKVFFEKDKASFLKLSHALRSFRDVDANVRHGLDGVVFYSGGNFPRMMSFTTGKKRIKVHPVELKASSAATDIEDAFCAVLPPIVRAP